MFHPLFRHILLVAFLATLLASTSFSAPRYRVVDLGLATGASGAGVHGFGHGNQVLGRFDVAGTLGSHAARWTVSPTAEPLTVTDLGGLPGSDWSAAHAENDAGWIVGHSNTTAPQPRAVLWRNGQIVDIEGNADGNANIYALDVNDAGVICGFLTKSGGGGGWDAAIWAEDPNHPGRFDRTFLPLHPSADPMFGWTESQEIDASGRVLGRTSLGFGDRATIWEADGVHTPILLEPLGSSNQSMPGDMNELGDVVGYTMMPFGLDKATRWSRDAAHVPSELPGWPGYNAAHAGAVDPSGTIVLGRASLVDVTVFPWVELEHRVVLWKDGGLWDLNEQLDASGIGWTIRSAQDINGNGWIAADADFAGVPRGVLLVPVPDVTGTPSGPQSRLALGAPRPNPSRGEVRVSFALPRAGSARLVIVDAQGRRVATLFDGEAAAGAREVVWNGQDAAGALVAPGLFFATLESSEGRITTRIARIH